MDDFAKPTYSAYQSAAPGEVTLTADGKERSGGFLHELTRLSLDTFPPQFRFERKRPTGPSTDVITPYHVSASFHAEEFVSTKVRVTDAWGTQELYVTKRPVIRP